MFVTINYRLGRLGFFAHPALEAEHPDELHGNYGLMDQIAALKWVKANIAGGEEVWSVAEGNGPVNALDQALRKDLGRYQSHIKDVELADYKVRILTGGSEAITRVLVESRDRSTGERWFTVGVSPNIVDASFEALVDSIIYKLLRAGAAA